MEAKRYSFIDKTLAAFRLGMINDFLTLILVMDRSGISHNELVEFKNLKASAMSNNQPEGVLCPECKNSMLLEYVNINARTVTGDDSKEVYTCVKCMHQIYE